MRALGQTWSKSRGESPGKPLGERKTALNRKQQPPYEPKASCQQLNAATHEVFRSDRLHFKSRGYIGAAPIGTDLLKTQLPSSRSSAASVGVGSRRRGRLGSPPSASAEVKLEIEVEVEVEFEVEAESLPDS